MQETDLIGWASLRSHSCIISRRRAATTALLAKASGKPGVCSHDLRNLLRAFVEKVVAINYDL